MSTREPETRHHVRRHAASTLLLAGMAVLLVTLACILVFRAHQSGRNSLDNPAAAARGRYDFATGSCISCHALYPISSAGAAIDLTHEGSKRSFVWLQHEIRFPTSQRPPTPGGQADDLAAFLASLR